MAFRIRPGFLLAYSKRLCSHYVSNFYSILSMQSTDEDEIHPHTRIKQVLESISNLLSRSGGVLRILPCEKLYWKQLRGIRTAFWAELEFCFHELCCSRKTMRQRVFSCFDPPRGWTTPMTAYAAQLPQSPSVRIVKSGVSFTFDFSFLHT